MHDIIRIDHLSKRFGEVQAVQDLSFRVKEGELFAFLGVNGAGKSTTINILCGQLAKDGGSVEIDGADPDRDPDRVRRELGVVFQNSVLDGALSVRDNLQSRAALYGIRGAAFAKRLAELAQLLDFGAILDRPVGRLSGGQRRRIDIARALLHRPKILIFDEPTTGLDPQTRRLLWDVVTELRRKEKLTVFLTTHYMEEAADVLLLGLDVLLLSLFGTALSSIVNCNLTTNGQASAVGTIVSAGYGFLCGAYMPISNFGEGLQRVLSFLPGTYGTALFRNHALRGVYAEMTRTGFPAEVVEHIKDSIDCNLYFFGSKVSIGAMTGVMAGSVAVLIGIYILMNLLKKTD